MPHESPFGINIQPASRGDQGLEELLKIHAQYCAQHTPKGSGHAIEPEVVTGTPIQFWLAIQHGKPVGSIGLSLLDKTHAEIKSLHVITDVRRSGLGESLLAKALEEANSLGMTRVSLETGKGDGFSASRDLYRKVGFSDCKPFGSYRDDPFSHCMTRNL
ncbi:GNAT family N-acetyltransferase [Erythrobacter sp. HA6-11]